jgi:hypothetical protein
MMVVAVFGPEGAAVSGGEYDYLYARAELDELLGHERMLEAMADRLAGFGWAEDAACETQELLVQLRQWKVRAQVRVRRLADVWHAVEWMDSGDCREDAVRKALAGYRGEG